MKNINELLKYKKYWVLNGKSTTYKKKEVIGKYGYFDGEKKFWYLFTSPGSNAFKEIKKAGLNLKLAIDN